MIQHCDFTVHDLSRCQSTGRGELARFNMPFELGLAAGLKEYGGHAFAHKRMLVLDAKKHRYDKVISDLSGHDIKIHNNKERKMVWVIRDWLSSLRTDNLPAGEKIMEEFRSFISNGFPEIARERGYTKRSFKKVPYHEFVEIAETWIAGKRKERKHIRPQ